MNDLVNSHSFRSSGVDYYNDFLSTSRTPRQPLSSRRDMTNPNVNIQSKNFEGSLSKRIDEEDFMNLSMEAQDQIINALQNLTKDFFPKNVEKRKSITQKSKTPPPFSSSRNFEDYYEKSCKGFLQKKNNNLEKQRIKKDEEEIQSLTSRPTLISKPESKRIPLFERIRITEAKKQKEIEKAKKEREEKEKQELQKLTFKPNINPNTDAILCHVDKVGVIERLYQNKNSVGSRRPLENQTKEKFRPFINENSKALAEKVIKMTSSKVEERLLLQAQLSQFKKEKLFQEEVLCFTPRLNKNTLKIVEQMKNKNQRKRKVSEESLLTKRMLQSSSKRTRTEIEDAHISTSIVQNKSLIEPEKDVPSDTNLDLSKMDHKILDNLKQLTLLLQKDKGSLQKAK